MGNSLRLIRIKAQLSLPPFVEEVLSRLNQSGHLAYLVGGSVRDYFFQLRSKDYDIATDALPDQLICLFPKSVTVGKAFGVIKVSRAVEVATFRNDLEYEDARHPHGVVFSSPEQDASRRDFSMNALFYDHQNHQVLDFVGGVSDIQAGVLRAIGDPMARFREDALRLLRAVRFKVRFGFKLESETQKAIEHHASWVEKISRERIRDELTMMWLGKNPHEALLLLFELGLLPFVLPELAKALSENKNLWKKLVLSLSALGDDVDNKVSLIWALLFYELGDPQKIGQSLKMSGKEIQTIVHILSDHVKLKSFFEMSQADVQRLIRQPHFGSVLELEKILGHCKDSYQHALDLWTALVQKKDQEIPRWISGDDLIQMGMNPGPLFSKILKSLEDQILEKKINSREEALQYIKRNQWS